MAIGEQRSGRPALTRDQVVAAAVALLDEQGPAGLNMRALGRRLKSAATAVYWHVGSKAALIELASDSAWGEIPANPGQHTSWRDSMSCLAGEAHAMLLRHPWVVELFGSISTFSLNKARYDERSLELLELAGLDADSADRAATALFTYILGNALGNAARTSLNRTAAQDSGDTSSVHKLSYDELLRDLPRLRSRVGGTAAADATSPEGSFRYGLALILDGLAIQLEPLKDAQEHTAADLPNTEQPEPVTSALRMPTAAPKPR